MKTNAMMMNVIEKWKLIHENWYSVESFILYSIICCIYFLASYLTCLNCIQIRFCMVYYIVCTWIFFNYSRVVPPKHHVLWSILARLLECPLIGDLAAAVTNSPTFTHHVRQQHVHSAVLPWELSLLLMVWYLPYIHMKIKERVNI